MSQKFSTGAIVLFLLGGSACGPRASEDSTLTIDSAHVFAADAAITEGRIHTTGKKPTTLESQIRAQLRYLVGQLNGVQGGPQLDGLQIKVNEVVPVEAGGYDVRYEATFVVAWPQGRALPESYEVILPARADKASLSNFVESLKTDCISPTDHDITTGNFWYYYRPRSQDCTARLADATLDPLVVRLPMTMAVSGANTNGKSPEYHKVWEDERLVVTAVFGKYKSGATEDKDAGIAAYNEMYTLLRRTWGEPSQQDVAIPADTVPGVSQPALNMIFQTPEGALDVTMMLVDSIASADEAFMQLYSERTKISDFVSYNGHSDLGSNIRAMARMGTFEAGQYQIFFVNGCDTLAYIDSALWDAHAAVNPDAAPTKFLDMITNAMPSYFRSNADNNVVMIRSLLERKKTYRDILAGFDRSQRALVMGEEDNELPVVTADNR